MLASLAITRSAQQAQDVEVWPLCRLRVDSSQGCNLGIVSDLSCFLSGCLFNIARYNCFSLQSNSQRLGFFFSSFRSPTFPLLASFFLGRSFKSFVLTSQKLPSWDQYLFPLLPLFFHPSAYFIKGMFGLSPFTPPPPPICVFMQIFFIGLSRGLVDPNFSYFISFCLPPACFQ